MRTAVVVFTRDLRIRDQPALTAAAQADRIAPLFVLDDAVLQTAHASANRLQFLLDSLADLNASLGTLGGALIVRRGAWVEEVTRVVAESGADVAHVSDDVSGFARARLEALRATGTRQGFDVVAHPGVTVVDPRALVTGAGTPYQVFTPFYRRWIAAPWRAPVDRPSALILPANVEPGGLPALSTLTPRHTSPALARGGETAALAQLRAWTAERLATYDQGHDAVAEDATSRISPFLHFGCLSPLEVAARLRDRPGGEAFVRQLCWRDFFHQLLASRPELAHQDLRSRGTPTGQADDPAYAAWCTGRTGFPLVDAGMRQLLAEGFMHNRVRMVAASFLTKDLDLPWQLGARHFMDLLIDGDIANNQLNWQWVAGTGTDSNPHRVFNPTRQSERFDPTGEYIRRYVPELDGLEAPLIHDPPDSERNARDYPAPLVAHADAVAAYRARISSAATDR